MGKRWPLVSAAQPLQHPLTPASQCPPPKMMPANARSRQAGCDHGTAHSGSCPAKPYTHTMQLQWMRVLQGLMAQLGTPAGARTRAHNTQHTNERETGQVTAAITRLCGHDSIVVTVWAAASPAHGVPPSKHDQSMSRKRLRVRRPAAAATRGELPFTGALSLVDALALPGIVRKRANLALLSPVALAAAGCCCCAVRITSPTIGCSIVSAASDRPWTSCPKAVTLPEPVEGLIEPPPPSRPAVAFATAAVALPRRTPSHGAVLLVLLVTPPRKPPPGRIGCMLVSSAAAARAASSTTCCSPPWSCGPTAVPRRCACLRRPAASIAA